MKTVATDQIPCAASQPAAQTCGTAHGDSRSVSTAVDTAVQRIAVNAGTGDSPRVVTQRRRIGVLLSGTLQQQTKEHQEAIQAKPQPGAAQPDQTSLPDRLRVGIESLSGVDMSAVRVHRNSRKPAQLQALAYAQGTEIHLGPGQERHLPHEAWHVVQQAQGRARPTKQLKGRIGLNDDVALEAEADAMGTKALNTTPGRTEPERSGLHAPSPGALPVQRIRIRLDHGVDPIMNNVRAAKVPRPGDTEVDGLVNYEPDDDAIAADENIVLEGHGTYLTKEHARDAPYDSQAYLDAEQLANVAFLVPKPPDWHGQIILFGCATGPLTLDVSKHYLTLSGMSVNVVGTLADIRMELPDARHAGHYAEYDRVDGEFPRVRSSDSVSARTQYRRWLYGLEQATNEVREALLLFKENHVTDLRAARAALTSSLSAPIQKMRQALVTPVTYEGGSRTASDTAIALDMAGTADVALAAFKIALNDAGTGIDAQMDQLEGLAVFFCTFGDELNVFDRQALQDAKAVPPGTVDWEGENVRNSKAKPAEGLPTRVIPKDELVSDKWGGGGQLLAMTMTLTNNEGEDFT